jgi:hypothetical protein
MSKSMRIWLIGRVALVVLLTATFHFVNRRLVGIPGFYVWKAVSQTPRDHGNVAIDDAVIYYETYASRSTVSSNAPERGR